MSFVVPPTTLEAVNMMLHDIGERPVNQLDEISRLDVTRALNSLQSASRMTQANGWWFNTENVELQIDGSGHYIVPDDIVHAEVLSGGPVAGNDDYDVELVQRGNRLYDRANATDTFALTSENVVLRCVRLLDYGDLPENAREYIYCAASIRFQSRTLGSSAVDADLRAQAEVALANLKEEDIDHENIDQTTSPHFFNLMYNR